MSIGRWTRGLALAFATGLTAAACSGNPDPAMAGLDGDGSYVVVDNTNTTLGTATIYLIPTNGIRERLGTVTMNEEKAFEVQRSVGLEYRLLAEHGVDEFASRPFTLAEGDVVEWNLDLNQIQYRGVTGQ